MTKSLIGAGAIELDATGSYIMLEVVWSESRIADPRGARDSLALAQGIDFQEVCGDGRRWRNAIVFAMNGHGKRLEI
jgi:hypothetical protein